MAIASVTARLAVYFGIAHMRRNVPKRTGRLDEPVAEVTTQASFVNNKTFTIRPGEILSVNRFTTNPLFDLMMIVPKTPGCMLIVHAIKDSATSGSNLSPSGSDAMNQPQCCQYPFFASVGISDVLVNPTAATDYGIDPGDGFPLSWEDGASVGGYHYAILVECPKFVPDVDAFKKTGVLTEREQVGEMEFDAMLVQGTPS